jgi:CRISPR-associated endonuclease/helicase Cas3
METTVSMLAEAEGALDLSDPALLESYFRRLYFKTTERAGLQTARTGLNFATTASLSRLIEDGFSTPLFVPYRDKHYDSEQVLTAFRRAMNTETFRALQPYLVQIRPIDRLRLNQLGGIERVNECLDVFSPLCANLYDPRFGLMIDEESKNDQSAYVV